MLIVMFYMFCQRTVTKSVLIVMFYMFCQRTVTKSVLIVIMFYLWLSEDSDDVSVDSHYVLFVVVRGQ